MQAAVLLPTVRLALHFISVSRLKDFGSKAIHDPRSTQLPPRVTARMVRVAASRGLYRFKCLDQSLVLRWLLRRQGIDARIVFGARKEDGQIEAHAWVECQGIAVNEDGDVCRYFPPFECVAAAAQTEVL
jgi:hypothetical protein